MKCMIPEISWHNREPVLSIDIQPLNSEFYRLATGGSDSHVLIWRAKLLESGAVSVDMVADLLRHQRAVNCVRWSSNGQYLASADDDANIIIWNLKTDNIPLLEGESNDKEIWVVYKILRGHKEDIYDLCWSPNALKLLSGSIDNTAIIWDLAKGKLETILTDHKGFVQGVTWDPKDQYLATLSSDRFCRVFDSTGKHVKARIGKGLLPVSQSHPLYNKEVKFFHDDTFKSYFRRIQFSPDGNLIIAPAGCVETEDCKKALSGTFLFTLNCLTQPVAILPLKKQCSVAVRCCPVLFELHLDGPDPVVNLPYRMIIAVATDMDVILYDTQQLAPFSHLQNIHYTRLTDLSWSSDGMLLTASSTDGFCTLITFKPNELGVPYVKEDSEIEDNIMNISGFEELDKEDVENKKDDQVEHKPKRKSFLLQWANKVQNKDELKTQNNKNALNDRKIEPCASKVTEAVVSPRVNNKKDKVNILIPKRIQPVKITNTEVPCNKKVPQKSPIAKPIAVRRKPRIVDQGTKASSLFTYFKPTPSPKKTAKNKPNTSKSFGQIASDVITIVDESEARDSWNCEENMKMDVGVDEDTEDIPDFKLQLEESTLTSQSNIKQSETAKFTNDDVIVIDDDDHQNSKTEKENDLDKIEEIKTDPNSNKSNVTKEQSQKELLAPLKNEDTLVKRIPRRIPLITLSSPKNKKQRADT